jgi:hypothetical protein
MFSLSFLTLELSKDTKLDSLTPSGEFAGPYESEYGTSIKKGIFFLEKAFNLLNGGNDT